MAKIMNMTLSEMGDRLRVSRMRVCELIRDIGLVEVVSALELELTWQGYVDKLVADRLDISDAHFAWVVKQVNSSIHIERALMYGHTWREYCVRAGIKWLTMFDL